MCKSTANIARILATDCSVLKFVIQRNNYRNVQLINVFTGLYTAALDLDVEWVVIKGVSDFADGRKSKTDAWRPFASTMAASLTAHFLLSNSFVFKAWPHYGRRKYR